MSAPSQAIRGHPLGVAAQPWPVVDSDPPGVFVGRQRELQALRAERRRSEQGELRVAVVLGDAGSGKTRLAKEAVAGGAESVVALHGRCSRLRPEPPIARWASELGRSGSGEGMLDVLAALSAERPIVIVLDDAHWADDTFWTLLLALSQEHPHSRLLVLTTARPDQLAGNRAAAEVLSTLELEDVLHRVPLGPLERNDVAELANTTRLTPSPAALVDWLMVRSQGIPRFVVGLLDRVVSTSGDSEGPGADGVPEGLARWVHAELAQHDAAQLAILEMLAVVGSPVDPDDLADIAGEAVEGVALTLERLVRTGMVLEQDHSGPLGYEIAHPVVREVLYASLAGARRRVLHQRAAAALGSSGRAEAATLHVLRSAPAGDSDVIHALIAQARQAGHQGSDAMLWAIVPTLVDALPAGDARWLELFDVLSWPRPSTVSYRTAQSTQPQVGAVLRVLEQLSGIGDAHRHAGILARTGGLVGTGAGTGAELEPGDLLCRDALLLRPDAGVDHDARLAAIELANRRGWSGDIAGQETDARDVLRGAEAAADQSAAVGALGALGLALGLQGRFAEAEEVLLRGVELAPAADHPFVEAHTQAVLASQDAFRGHMAAARARWSLAAESQTGPHALVWESGAFIALLGGELATVKARARRAELDLPRQLSPPWLALFSAMADAEQGRTADARDSLDRIVREYDGDELDLFSQYRRWGEGLVDWSEGRTAAALAILQRGVDRCSAMGAVTPLALLLVDLAEVAAGDGESRAAARAAALTETLARRVDAPSFQAFHHFARAWSLLAAGSTDDAAREARRAVDDFAAIGFPVMEGRARVAYARAVRGNRAVAVAALDEAVAAFELSGAVVRAGRARSLLAEVGSSAADRVTVAPGEPALTGRERQIAELAAAGFTARQIGAQLHIGVRTVETHLARVYRKLGVGSKQQLVSRRIELGLVTSP